MVQIKVTDEGIEDVSERVPEDEPEENSESKEDDQQALEIPLENMTKDELLEEINKYQNVAEENYDRYMRCLAEIENLKKRYRKDKEDLIKYSNESLIKSLLSVLDNLENAITASEDENALDAVKQGVELTLKDLLDTLIKKGLQTVEAYGKPFDPNFHEAISEQEDDTAEPGTILHELQKGYTLNDRLIRPAMVIVNKKSS